VGVGIDPDREDLAVDPARGHPREVHVARVVARAEVVAVVHHPHQGVGVGVQHEGLAVDPGRALRGRLGRRRRGRHRGIRHPRGGG
jgi:hypothetical protein